MCERERREEYQKSVSQEYFHTCLTTAIKPRVIAYSGAKTALACFNGTLYPILGTGVQETMMEVSVTSVLK